MRAHIALLMPFVLMCGCGEEDLSITEARVTAPVLHVVVMADGSIMVDGQTVDLRTLGEQLPEHAEAYGLVNYAREDSGPVQSPTAEHVIDLLLQHELAIALSAQFGEADTAAGM